MNFKMAAQGASFRGAMAYYTHDKREGGGPHLQTSERVAWTETRNLATERTDTATQIMVATARDADRLKREAGVAATGRRAEKPVLAYSLAWHPDEAKDLTRAEMVSAANASLQKLGLENHQAVLVAHRDTAHPHVHVIVNRVSAEDGRLAKIGPTQVRALDRWANDYEQSRGRIVSPNRAAKYDRQRQQPDAAARKAHATERRESSKQRVQDLRQAVAQVRPVNAVERAVQDVANGQHSRAEVLRAMGAEQRDRHKEEWSQLGETYKAERSAIYGRAAERQANMLALHKSEAKGEWRNQFAHERALDRNRAKLERTTTGRLSLAIAAAREERAQGSTRSFAALVAVHFVSRDRREAVFATVTERDRNGLSARLNQRMGERFKEVRDERGHHLDRAKEGYTAQRSALIERQNSERKEVRIGWQDLRNERTAERAPERAQRGPYDYRDRKGSQTPQERQKAPEKAREAQRSAFDWLDKTPEQKAEQQKSQAQDRSKDRGR